MATAAADTTITESRRLPAALSNLSGLLIVGGAFLLLIVAGVARSMSGESDEVMHRFWRAYLLNATFVTSLSVGGLFFVIHHLTGGRWGTSLRRLAEIVAGTMLTAALLFSPIVISVALGSDNLYEWGDRELVAGDPILAAKGDYLSPKWFAIRTIGYFALWCYFAWFFVGGSVKQDETGEVAPLRRLSAMSGPSMMLLAVTLNFAAFDWLMSLAPHWFSTIFGVYFFIGSAIGFMALLILLAIGLQSRGVLTQSITTDNLHDAAKLMYAFIVFWGYIAFSQFLLIWYANVPEETEWYGVRQPDGATMFGIPSALGWLFVLHLFIPFLGFMSSAVRRNKLAMTIWAIYMLVVHWLDLVFIIMPDTPGYEGTFAFAMIGPFEVLCLVGVAAVMIGAMIHGAHERWLLPVRDPRLHQARTYHNH